MALDDAETDRAGTVSRKWQIDKTIPVSLIVVILFQSLGLFAWAVGLQGRVSTLETTSVTRESYARLDEKMNSVKEDISGLKNELANNSAELRRVLVRGHQ